jgi:hypothetical protein
MPTIGLEAGLKTIEVLAIIVNKFLEAWEKIAKIRRVKGELTEMGIAGPPVEHLRFSRNFRARWTANKPPDIYP